MAAKKVKAFVVAIVLIIGISTSCSSNMENGSSPGSRTGKNGLEILKGNGSLEQKLTFWTAQQVDMNIKSTQQSAVEDFETANNCGVQITSYPYVELQDKMLIAVASGQGPDILTVDQIWVPQYAASKFIVTLDELLLNSVIKESNYFSSAWQAGKYQGRTYAVPFDVGVWALLYYNKSIFREAGLDPEKPPQTWSEFLETGRRLTGNGKFGMAAYSGSEATQCVIDAFTFSAGGAIIDDKGKKAVLNSQAGVKALDFWKACAEISPPGTVARAEEDSFKLFTSGQVAMFFYGEWGQDTIKARTPALDYGVARLPSPEGGESIGTFGGYNLGINSKCRNKELAWRFIEYATGEEVEKKITMLTPAHKDAALEYLKEKRKNPEAIYQQLSNSSFRPSVRNYPEISAVQGVALQEVLLNQKTPREALNDAAAKIDGLLAGQQGGS